MLQHEMCCYLYRHVSMRCVHGQDNMNGMCCYLYQNIPIRCAGRWTKMERVVILINTLRCVVRASLSLSLPGRAKSNVSLFVSTGFDTFKQCSTLFNTLQHSSTLFNTLQHFEHLSGSSERFLLRYPSQNNSSIPIFETYESEQFNLIPNIPESTQRIQIPTPQCPCPCL